ncbi:hypothetical protein DCC81_06815 [Chitinophaga parva]|uniref:Uncharacterized protein n=1 Tax=Chitinophaga parva TaxID=2169414 RepID=A0A2T7BND8_9BACT|nr:hypothetical protein DCC81_06815 [Chitinophaga parva]
MAVLPALNDLQNGRHGPGNKFFPAANLQEFYLILPAFVEITCTGICRIIGVKGPFSGNLTIKQSSGFTGLF